MKNEKLNNVLYIILVTFLLGCSEISPNGEGFIVERVESYENKIYQYKLKPLKGLGVLFVKTGTIYNVGDTLQLGYNCN